MSIDISLTIEEIVKKKNISYMEAILEYTNEVDGEIEGIAKMLNKSIKDKIEVEAEELNMFKKSAKLPI
jgi:DNA-directed RNA polymerase alpha subunit